MIDTLVFIAWGLTGSAIMAILVSLISDEPVRCGFDVIKGAAE